VSIQVLDMVYDGSMGATGSVQAALTMHGQGWFLTAISWLQGQGKITTKQTKSPVPQANWRLVLLLPSRRSVQRLCRHAWAWHHQCLQDALKLRMGSS